MGELVSSSPAFFLRGCYSLYYTHAAIVKLVQIHLSNWLPFYWRGFEQTTRYTYVIEPLADLERVWSEFSKKLRWEIRKAQKQLTLRTDLGIERFLDINALTFKRQGLDIPYGRDVVRRVDVACAKHQARRMFFAEDARGRTHVAKYVAWNEVSAYYL